MRSQASLCIVSAVVLLGGLVPASPAGAAPRRPAEPDTAQLAGDLIHQRIGWENCEKLSTDPETDQLLHAVPGLACATVTVPRDWHHPRDGNTITLRVSKTATSRPGADRQGIALVNPGGPGGSGLAWGAAMAVRSPELAASYDFIGFDPRGVGASTPLSCSYQIDPANTDPNVQTKAVVSGCRTMTPLARYITTEQTAYDMDFLRALLGERQTSYVGYSYGTWLGTWYATTFPSRVHRMLLDSSTDVSEPSLQKTWDLQTRSRDRAFQNQFLPYVARHDATYHLGTDPQAIRRQFERYGGNRGLYGKLITALIIIPAMYSKEIYPLAAEVLQGFIADKGQIGGGDPEDAAVAAFRELVDRAPATGVERTFLNKARSRAEQETRQTNAVFEAIRCQDGQWNQSLAHWRLNQRDLDRNYTFIAPLSRNGDDTLYPACAFWPTRNRMPLPNPRTFPKVMVVQSEMDAATAYEGAHDTARYLPGARMISVDNEGSHGVFPYLTTCVDDPVISYFRHGSIPAAKYSACPALPLPGEDRAYDVGGRIGPGGTIHMRLVTGEVRRANLMVHRMLRDQELDPNTGQPSPTP
ncbi:alpha/beta hydrolase [Actinoplanes sp. NPDC049265]|uniref:alpha/beta hydrolase n=1 Tax=Actinoplanes sp. NPDC049265 TaxID=3363902 RepID=UPI00371CD4F9